LSTSAAQFQFVAEFVAFLAAAAGLALVVLGGDLLTRVIWARLAMAVGFAALLAAAFLHGSLLIDESSRQGVAGLRFGGIVAVALGAWQWRGRRSSRQLLLAGLLLTGVAGGLALREVRTAGDATLIAGSVGVGAALYTASRRAIAARVAASAAATLLLLVLVLSVGLSAVLSRSAEREAVRRLGDTISTQAELTTDTASRNALENARETVALIAGRLTADDLRVVATADPASTNATVQAAVGKVRTVLEGLTGGVFPPGQVGLVYVEPSGVVLLASRTDPVVATELSGSPVVAQAVCPREERTSATIANGQAFAVATVPVCVGVTPMGKLVAVRPFDRAYLDLTAGRNGPSLALVGRTGVVATTTGDQAPTDTVRRLADAVVSSGTSTSTITDTTFVAARPVFASDRTPLLALVGSTPTSSVADTRDALFRTLFLIALGGTLLALVLAAFVGDRIGAGLRRLTFVAEGIQRGDLSVRADIDSEDEVGVLGAAFDSMAISIGEKTTALLEAADAEARSASRLEAVFAGVGDALIAVDSEGLVTDFNRAAEELTGVSAPAARNRRLADVLTLVGEDGSDLATRAANTTATRWTATGETTAGDGTTVPVAMSVGAVRGPGSELVGTVLVVRDLRPEREVERMKTEFLSRVGHELRTPLTGIIGYSEILLVRKVGPERQRIWHEEILDASKRLLRIVEMLEFVASAGAGRVLLRPEQLDVRKVVEDVVSRWTGRLNDVHTITRRVSRRLPAVVADRRWVTLAIDELVDNAVKFSPDGARVTIVAEPAVNDRAVKGVEISVVDRGKGMSVTEQAEAFGDFVQGDTSDTRKFGGLGLGLGLVKRVVEGHGGTVTCESEPNKGSRFTIFLPASDEARG